MIYTLIIWIRFCMMRIVIRCKGWFVLNMVWCVGIGVCFRMGFLILNFPCFVRTRHYVSDNPLKFINIPTSYKKCR